MTRSYVVGLDLGQAADFTALAVVEAVTGDEKGGSPGEGTYQVRHLERFPLKTTYPAIVERVQQLTSTLQKEDPHVRLIVDHTGVGAAVVDLLVKADLSPIAITITGGDQVTHEGRLWRVPKRDLVAVLAVAFQSGRLKIARDLPESATLVNELLNFKVKINLATAHDSYEAWRSGQHDDLVLAVALAVWAARKMVPTENRFPLVGIRRRW
jgi:hypothetical protein